jgi:hypothetical protein
MQGGDWAVAFQALTRLKSRENERNVSPNETKGFATGGVSH